jgi:hypothetical protein
VGFLKPTVSLKFQARGELKITLHTFIFRTRHPTLLLISNKKSGFLALPTFFRPISNKNRQIFRFDGL